MLFIFRKLRRSFFLPGKVRTYCAYAVGEIVLIVVGILLALQISEWNQSREDRAEETEILQRLKSEFEANQEKLEDTVTVWTAVVKNLIAFENLMGPNPEPQPDELIYGYLMNLLVIWPYAPNTEELKSLQSTGKISLIQNQELNHQLNMWRSELEYFNMTFNYLAEQRSHDFLRFRDYFPYRNLKFGHSDNELLTSFYEMLSQYITTELAEGIGPSQFDFNQKGLLMEPTLEDAVEFKRLQGSMLVLKGSGLLEIQQSILALIDADLAERGLGEE